jgi:hypothetical protein
MTIRPHRGALLLFGICLAFGPVALEAQDRRPLDHDAYEIWRTIGAQAISPDGRWVLYTLELEDDDDELVVRRVGSEVEHRIPRGAGPTFGADGRFVIFIIRPHLEATRKARDNREDRRRQPRDSLGILTLATGEVTRVADVRNFRLAGEESRGLAYHLHPPHNAEG